MEKTKEIQLEDFNLAAGTAQKKAGVLGKKFDETSICEDDLQIVNFGNTTPVAPHYPDRVHIDGKAYRNLSDVDKRVK